MPEIITISCCLTELLKTQSAVFQRHSAVVYVRFSLGNKLSKFVYNGLQAVFDSSYDLIFITS